MASSVDITGLTAKLQVNTKDNPNVFTRKLVNNLNLLDYFTVIDDVEDEVDLTQLVTGDVLQPGNRGAFEPKDDIHSFVDRIGRVEDVESSLRFKQAQIQTMWRSHLAKKRQSTQDNPYDMPFADLIEAQTVAAAISNLRQLAMFKGVKNVSGTTSSDLFNGLNTLIAADVTATLITAATQIFTGAAITASTAVAQIHGVRDKLIAGRSEIMNDELVCLAAPENVSFYWQNYQTLHGSLPYNTDYMKRSVEGLSNCPLMPEIGLAGSDKVIITTKGNLVFMTNALSKMSEITYEKSHRDLDMMLDFKAGINYIFAEYIYSNDQA